MMGRGEGRRRGRGRREKEGRDELGWKVSRLWLEIGLVRCL